MDAKVLLVVLVASIVPSIQGEWAPWWDYTACDCRTQTKLRVRACNPPQCNGIPYEIVPCTPDCGYGWSEWNVTLTCSVSCGTGRQVRQRSCLIGNCFSGIGYDESRPCYMGNCPGFWLSWQAWSGCTASCGNTGVRNRFRSCSRNDAPCVGGTNQQRESCPNTECGGWMEWGNWGGCSLSCGANSVRTRTRACRGVTNQGCLIGSAVDTQRCNMATCPFWSQWTTSACPVSCGGGQTWRERVCQGTGSCEGGNYREQVTCSTNACPAWGQWSAFTTCFATCGTQQMKYRTRQCPVQGQCPGSAREDVPCGNVPCPGWNAWSFYTACQPTCGTSMIRSRERICPVGVYCPGNSRETQQCQAVACPAYWAQWTGWRQCSTTCGPTSEYTYRTRSCMNQAQGQNCPGSGYETRSCYTTQCPASWTTWTTVGSCSTSCGRGTVLKRRNCQGADLNNRCEGLSEERQECDMGQCLGVWSDWSIGQCSKSCGQGVQIWTRECMYGGDCIGTKVEYKHCTWTQCSGGVAAWEQWTAWTGCSGTCGTSYMTRTRRCPSCTPRPLLQTLYKTCVHPNACPAGFARNAGGFRPIYGEWSKFTICSQKCGNGSQIRTRKCENCDETIIEMHSCTAKCKGDPYVESWSDWSDCSATCGNGVRTRLKSCNGNCGNREVETEPCKARFNGKELACTTGDNGYDQWTPWKCDAECGIGISKRFRKCRLRKKKCFEPEEQQRLCHTKQCEGDDENCYDTFCFKKKKGDEENN